ncbi:MAG: matrixin family metalloprotease [Candidatus Doudnabacteria bacterium]
MSKYKNLIIFFIFIVLAAAGGVFYYQSKNLHLFAKPCTAPITYSIGTFDPKFGVTQQKFLDDVNQAVQIWDMPISKDLFQYSAAGKLKINLVYDYRQEATDKLRALGLTIDDSQSSYNTLKARYDSLSADDKVRKQKLDADTASYEKQRAAYEQQVNYWNSNGGADRQTAAQLNAQRDQLNAQAAQINQEKDQFNAIVDQINALASTLNRIGSALNLNVSQYNTVGQSRGQEFEEGLYKSDSSGNEIDIYEFDNQNQLIRVLAHELGHALGLSHINTNPEAIMYYLNQGKNEKLTAEDISAVKQLCGINN